MKKIFTAVAASSLLFVGTVANAQQDPQFTQNMFNRLYSNAGYAGTSDGICATALHRQQWVGFNGRPVSTVINIDGTVKALHGGLGLSILSDKLGAQYSGGVKLSYSYHLKLGGGILGIGVEGGILFNTLDGSQLNPIQSGDQNIITSNQGGVASDLGFGLYYRSDKLYAGISANHLIGPTLEYAEGGNISEVTIARHYYAMAGYTWDVSANFALLPSVFVKTDAASAQFDLNLNVMWKNMIWAGASYRIDDAVAILAGVQLYDFRLGYSYDITTSGLNSYSNGSHEVMLGYCYKLRRPVLNQRYRNVRFL